MPSANSDEVDRFAEYFSARRDAVRRTAYLLCGDWHWAEDLTQAAFVRLAAGWHRVRDRVALDAYVRTCLMRTYLAETRRVWRRRERVSAQLPDVPAADGTEEVARRMEVVAALRRLAPRQRAVVVCRFYQGLDIAETAEVLGCSTGTVKSQTAKALARLRDVLGDSITEPTVPLDPRPLVALEGMS